MEVLAAWGALIVATALLLWEVYRVRVDQRSQMAAAYLQRFWEIDDDLLITEKGSAEHQRHRHRYLKLSEDEFEVARSRLLDLHLWQAWHDWMSSKDMRARIECDLASVAPESQRFTYLRECLKVGKEHRWWDCPSRDSRWDDWFSRRRHRRS